MIRIKVDRKNWNKNLRLKSDAVNKQDIADFNEWCDKHGVQYERVDVRYFNLVCPDANVAMLLKLQWL